MKDIVKKLVWPARSYNVSEYFGYSIYVYEKTDIINESFTGGMVDLQRRYDEALISYTRWTDGTLDIFYYMESGNIVYDILEKEEVSPTEFD